jgi:antitoxin (DNA-binding transcriptional repressor) of toxin-antitoxin stability system
MKTSIRRLRLSMKQILGAVQQGEEVVIYLQKKPIAKIVPIKEARQPEKDYGFGMWSDHFSLPWRKNFNGQH